MAGLKDHIAEAIEEYRQMSVGPWRDRPEERGRIPSWESRDDGRGVVFSWRLERAVGKVAEITRANRKDLARAHTRAEWLKVVRRAIALALLEFEPEGDLDAAIDLIRCRIRGAIDAFVEAWPPLEHAFPCTLLNEPSRDYPDFGIARFETREAWLQRKRLNREISAVSARRISKIWSGTRVGRRKRSEDAIVEAEILRAIGQLPYVCSVWTTSLAPRATEEKAALAARLALLGVALVFSMPAGALDGLNLAYDGPSYHRRTLVTAHARIYGGTRLIKNPHGPWADATAWSIAIADYSDVFHGMGELIAHSASSAAISPRTEIMRTLLHAALFYHEACREPLDVMAVMKFAASLDALSGGGGGQDILKLCLVRCGWLPEQTIQITGAPPLSRVIDRVYSDGRSKTLHGNNPSVDHDWSDVRAWAEYVGRNLLIACLGWAARNPNAREPSGMRASTS